MRSFALALCLASSACAWTPLAVPSSSTRSSSATTLSAVSTRQAFLQLAMASATSAVLLATSPLPAMAAASATETTLPNGVSYTVKQTGTGPKPEIGELVAIRFAAYNADIKIDDIFDTPEPYYTRMGSGGLLKGVESVLPLMKVGDRWVLSIPGELAFGKKGRPASAGKPRIPGDATITFDVEVVGLPGREVELIELIGDV
ncbi:hypothetical protein MPSEU_000666700 [Mayamaea pseudoterrestris]|nr:hypothetical protein MPSEU_000666700 [Mayamaea pseudoterrestris]